MFRKLERQAQTRHTAADDDKINLIHSGFAHSHPWRGLRWGANKTQDTTQRDRHPFRAVVEFIPKLIQGFQVQKAAEQEPEVLLIFRDKGSVPGFLEIGLQEKLAGRRRPKVSVGFKRWFIDRADGPRFQ